MSDFAPDKGDSGGKWLRRARVHLKDAEHIDVYTSEAIFRIDNLIYVIERDERDARAAMNQKQWAATS